MKNYNQILLSSIPPSYVIRNIRQKMKQNIPKNNFSGHKKTIVFSDEKNNTISLVFFLHILNSFSQLAFSSYQLFKLHFCQKKKDLKKSRKSFHY